MDDTIKEYMRCFGIKENAFSHNEMLIRTIDYFFHANIVFNRNKADDVVWKFYKHTKAEFTKLKKKKEISYDDMFEIITNFCILCSNTIQNETSNKKGNSDIHFKTIDIDLYGIINMIGASNNRFDMMKKIEDFVSQPKDGLRSLATSLILTTSVYINKSDKDFCLFMYLCLIIIVTYLKNEELKGIINYGW